MKTPGGRCVTVDAIAEVEPVAADDVTPGCVDECADECAEAGRLLAADPGVADGVQPARASSAVTAAQAMTACPGVDMA